MTEVAPGVTILKGFSHGTSKEELDDVYKKWSKNYDENTINGLRYCGPKRSADLLSQKLQEFGFSQEVRILDLGAGTGLVGEELHKLGYSNIDASDLSEQMLELAKEKGVYKNLIQGVMGSENSNELSIEAAQYDAVICTGVFTLGHVKSNGFDDLIYVVKPGGLACFSVRDDIAFDPVCGFEEKMEELCRDNKWKLVYKDRGYYIEKTDAWYFVCQVLGQ